MPTYTFQCHTCDKKVTVLLKSTDKPPKCCGVKMIKQIGTPTVIFKGKGWDRSSR